MAQKRIKCPWCGCMKEQTAEERCESVKDHSGEYDCPMMYVDTDKDGWFIQTL